MKRKKTYNNYEFLEKNYLHKRIGYLCSVKGKKHQNTWQAWILMLVFVPMMMLSFFHTHASEASIAAECHECLHHVHHSHFGTADQCIDQCVLCQFLSLSFIATTTAFILFAPICRKQDNMTYFTVVIENATYHISGRAPPM